uniref:DUF3444 domain-containing protein n=1 Tax=Ananas comosus var. bracteatus TaxID=296719 RepID=A0A6V7NEM1_ANACO|nr:unnamed protein product [Ananas comosus var. bracteatus]
MYKNWRPCWNLFDFENCEFDVVEICERSGAGTKVSLLTKVDGNRAVFMPDKKEKVVTILEDEYLRFSHQIPAFQLTDQKGLVQQFCVKVRESFEPVQRKWPTRLRLILASELSDHDAALLVNEFAS